MKLLSTYDVAELTGLNYAAALSLIKSMNYIRLDRRYYVSEANFLAFMTQETAVEISTTTK